MVLLPLGSTLTQGPYSVYWTNPFFPHPFTQPPPLPKLGHELIPKLSHLG